MPIDEELKNKIKAIEKSVQNHPVKLGTCARCGDFGQLLKTPWTDPYTDTTGWGWLCGSCVESSESAKVDHYYMRPYVKTTPSKEIHPVPKPKKKK